MTQFLIHEQRNAFRSVRTTQSRALFVTSAGLKVISISFFTSMHIIPDLEDSTHQSRLRPSDNTTYVSLDDDADRSMLLGHDLQTENSQIDSSITDEDALPAQTCCNITLENGVQTDPSILELRLLQQVASILNLSCCG